MCSAILTAKALQDARSLVRLDIEGGRPKRLRTNFVRKAIDRRTKLVDKIVDFVKACLGIGFGFLPESHGDSCGAQRYASDRAGIIKKSNDD